MQGTTQKYIEHVEKIDEQKAKTLCKVEHIHKNIKQSRNRSLCLGQGEMWCFLVIL